MSYLTSAAWIAAIYKCSRINFVFSTSFFKLIKILLCWVASWSLFQTNTSRDLIHIALKLHCKMMVSKVFISGMFRNWFVHPRLSVKGCKTNCRNQIRFILYTIFVPSKLLLKSLTRNNLGKSQHPKPSKLENWKYAFTQTRGLKNKISLLKKMFAEKSQIPNTICSWKLWTNWL